MATPTPDTEVPRLIIVDDTEPSIQYSPLTDFTRNLEGLLNQKGQGGPVFNDSITGTSSNSSLSYTFNGTFVRAMLAVELEGEAINWNCTVDGQAIPSFPISDTQITNFIACDSGKMLSGTTDEHTLDINFWFEQQPSNVSMIWLDSIQYQPLPSALMDGVSLRIHNSDPSITYSSIGAWEAVGAAGLPAIPGDTGTNVSFALGAGLEADSGLLVNFTFTATHVSLYGVNFAQYNDNTATCYTSEGPVFIDLPGMTSDISSTNDISNYLLFGLTLVSGQYNIGIATSDNKTLNPEPLSISYFVITTDLIPNPNTTPGSGSSTSAGSGSSSTGSGSATSSGLSTKSIIIIVVCIVAALVFAIITQWLRKRLDRQKVRAPYDYHESPQTGSDMTSLTPYSPPPANGTGGFFSGASGFGVDRSQFINGEQVTMNINPIFMTSPTNRTNRDSLS